MPIVVTPTTGGATFGDLLAEFYARGFDYLNDASTGEARAKRWINQAYFDLCAREDWPFLYTDTSGVAPLTITDLRTVLSVTNSTTDTPVPFADRRGLLDLYGDLTTAGTASWWYRDSQSTVTTYPVDTASTLAVRYVAKPSRLTATSDQVVVPLEWCDLIVDGAVLRAKKDDDLYDQYVQQFEAQVQRMVDGELIDGGGPDFVEVTNAVDG